MCLRCACTGFPEPAPLQAGSTGISHQCKQTEGSSDRAELETQPMLEPIPWEPHLLAPHD